MAYDKGRLNAKQVEAATKPGHVADGKGLYLQVSKWGTKSWVFKFTLGGRTRGMGLGPIDELSLKKAREEVERLRVMVREGRDPIEERAEQRRALKAKYEDNSTTMLFKDAIAKAHARKEGEFSNEKHRKDWRSSLDTSAVPMLGNMNVAEITHQDVLRVLNQPVNEAGGTLWEKRLPGERLRRQDQEHSQRVGASGHDLRRRHARKHISTRARSVACQWNLSSMSGEAALSFGTWPVGR